MAIGLKPAGVKLIGANFIAPGYNHDLFHPVHLNVLTGWDWQWERRTRPQIDRYKAMGFNVLKMQGGADGVHSGFTTLAEYCAEWVQLAEYCQSIGMYLFPGDYLRSDHIPAGAGHGEFTDACTNDQYATICAAVIVALVPYNSIIIGYDAWIEFDVELCYQGGVNAAAGVRAKVPADAQAIHDLIRAKLVTAGVTIPYGLTFSATRALTAYNTAINGVTFTAFADACDFISFHVYPTMYGATHVGSIADLSAGGTPPTTANALALSAAFSDKEIIFGEFGCYALSTNPTPETWVGAVLDIAMSANAVLRGATIYGMQYGLGVVESWSDYYLFNLALAPQEPLTKAHIKHSSTSVGPTTPATPVLLNRRLYINPRLSTLFSKVHWYKNGVLLSIADVGLLEDSTDWHIRQAYYEASVTTSGFAESTKSPRITVPAELVRGALRARGVEKTTR